MATNFQLIEAYPVDIENFSYDVSDMVDSIYIGPQGELLEKLEYFNHSYDCNIGVTKSFTLKPGGYDEIKKAYNRWVLRHDLKPRGIKSLFDRIQQYNWRVNGFRQQILDIETRMKNLKHSGMRWQDNTDQFEEEFDKFKDSIINSLNQTREIYPNIDITCKIVPVSEGRLQVYRRRGYWGNRQSFPSVMFSEDTVDFVLILYVKLKDPSMTVHIMDDDGTAEYNMPMGDIIIASGTYLLPLISRHWGRTTPMTANASTSEYSFFLEALYLSEMGKSEHPYIGRNTDKYTWELNGRVHSGNICTGNMDADIRNSLINNEIMAHIVQLVTWVTTYYVPQTNPLNRISKLRNFGDDIRFAQWRGDLNSTSNEVFSCYPNELPVKCNWSKSLLGSILHYTSNEDHNSMYNDRNLRFYEGDVEWPMRISEYLNTINVDDMPCNNCSFKSECNQWNVLQLVFKEKLTSEEEACFGMLYEYHEYSKNVLGRQDGQDRKEIYYAEMALEEAWRWDLDEEYFYMTMAHKICIWWAYNHEETFNTLGFKYNSRMKVLYGMGIDCLKHLFEHHYLVDDSKFVWTLDNIRDYRIPLSKEPANIPSPDTVIEEWLHQNDDSEPDDNLGRPASLSVDENMTPEQRTIRWAIHNGGANNL